MTVTAYATRVRRATRNEEQQAECFLRVTEYDRSEGQIYNVAGGRAVSIRDLVFYLIEILNLRDVSINFTGKSWPGDILTLTADITKTKKELGFMPRVSLQDGMSFLHSWLSGQGGGLCTSTDLLAGVADEDVPDPVAEPVRLGVPQAYLVSLPNVFSNHLRILKIITYSYCLRRDNG